MSILICERPAIPIIARLEENGAKVSIHDPHVQQFKWPIMKDLIEAVRDADAILIVTDHSEFAKLDLEELKAHMRGSPLIVNTRNILRDVPEGYVFVRFGTVV